jgi:hypothetical protein
VAQNILHYCPELHDGDLLIRLQNEVTPAICQDLRLAWLSIG